MPAPRPPRVSLDVANQARSDHRRVRAEYLIAVAEGVLTPDDIIRQAASDEGTPLRTIRLDRLLATQPHTGRATARKLLGRVTDPQWAGTKSSDLTVGWLLDNRSKGRRISAWLWASTPANRREVPPWAGFPFTPDPNEDGGDNSDEGRRQL